MNSCRLSFANNVYCYTTVNLNIIYNTLVPRSMNLLTWLWPNHATIALHLYAYIHHILWWILSTVARFYGNWWYFIDTMYSLMLYIYTYTGSMTSIIVQYLLQFHAILKCISKSIFAFNSPRQLNQPYLCSNFRL